MTDIEISKALALAIGWKPDQILEYEGQSYIGLPVGLGGRRWHRLFSYKFWQVIGPIAERYNAFPHQSSVGTWSACIGGADAWVDHVDTPQKAIALAVIEGAKL
jgi:hypothetical protein